MTPISSRCPSASHRLFAAALATLCALVALLALATTPASAGKVHVFDSSFGKGGSGPGQFKEPAGVAVNDETGYVYVVDKGNSRVQQFDSTGATVLGEFDGAAAPTGALKNPTDIAVDDSGNPLDPSENDVYVTGEVTVASEAVHVIYKFSSTGAYLGQITTGSGGVAFSELFGIAIDPNGELWVYQESKEIDSYSDASENAFVAARTDPRGAMPGFAVDSEDNLYVRTGTAAFAKLNSAGAELVFTVDNAISSGAAVDPESNDVYIDTLTGVGHYDSAAECTVSAPCGGNEPPAAFLDRFGEGHLSEGSGIAVNSASADKRVYVADDAGDAVKIFRQVVRPTVATGVSTESTPTSTTLNGTVNPEGLPVTSCSFEYGTSTAYGQNAGCQPSPGSGVSSVAVSAKLSGLQPDTTYHYRLVAGNENGQSEGDDESFMTQGPGLHGAGVVDVSADAATFQGLINPHNVPTSSYFQYGTSTSYGANVPVPPGLSLGEGEGDVEVAPQHVQGLSPDTLYHYRIVAVGDAEEFPGPDQTFMTQGAGGQLKLPDGRAWELVSPAEKHGATIEPIAGVGVVQAAASGDAFSYLANAPTEASPPGNAGEVQLLSTRTAEGWSSKVIASPHTRATGSNAPTPPEYRFFTEDLSRAIVQPFGLFEAQVSAEASEQTPYLRTLGSCTESCYRPLVSAKAGFANVPPGTRFGEEGRCEEENSTGNVATICGPRLIAATPEADHVVLSSIAPLVKGAPPGSLDGRGEVFGTLYEWSSESLQLISILPENEAGEELPAPEGTALLGAEFGLAEGSAKRAISNSGARVFWEAQEALYVRDSERQQTLQIDAAEAACLKEVASKCESGGGRFQIASTDGSSVLFTDSRRLMKDAGTSDLYECEIHVEGSGKLGCELSDLTPESSGESAQVQGNVLGASEDDQSVYFVAEGVLSATVNARGQSASAGQANLYVRRGGEISFITTLGEGDAADWSRSAEAQPARASGNGQWLSFMSEGSLSGYDNRDALSGKPDAEVFLYDAATAQLQCASCDPSGARPHGVEYAKLALGNGGEALVSRQSEWSNTSWVAALAPESVSFDNGKSAYQARYLSNSGRLFFNAFDSLLPQDVNGNWDVYEHEPAGVPEGPDACAPSSPAFSESSGGCLSLISSGASAQETAFLDASQSGGDVFFLTSAKLTPKDIDAARDVYDAHECTTASRCIAQEPETSPPCSTEASCRPAPTPQPQIYGAPSSSTFSGPGNPPPPPTPPPHKLSRHELLLKALASCHKRYPRSKARRGACERQAQHKYGAKKASRKKAAAKNSAKGRGK